MDAKRPTPRHIIIKRPKVKERLKSSKRKEVCYQMVARWKGDEGEWVKR